MKKMILLCLSVFGMTNFANAWMAYYPQSKTNGENHTQIVTCHNTTTDPCMAANGDNPKVGQTVAILDEHGIIGWGTIVECVATPEMDRNGNPPTGVPVVLGIEFANE